MEQTYSTSSAAKHLHIYSLCAGAKNRRKLLFDLTDLPSNQRPSDSAALLRSSTSLAKHLESPCGHPVLAAGLRAEIAHPPATYRAISSCRGKLPRVFEETTKQFWVFGANR